MALAGTTWDDYRLGGPVSPSTMLGGTLFAKLVMGTALVACATAGLYVLRGVEFADSAAPGGVPPDLVTARSATKASRPLPTNAERFLRDSLLLTRRCPAGCAEITAEISQAKQLGRFDPSTAKAGVSMLAGLPLQQGFAARIPAHSYPAAGSGAAGFAVTATPVAPVPVRISPSVVVPLPAPAVSAGTALLPAPGPNRQPEKAPALAAPDEPLLGNAEAPAIPARRLASTPIIGRNDGVAVYDISAATVYMPDGARLEAHSGLGSMVDNPHYVDRRNIGPTPPGTYNLQALDNLFFGVEALRMVPTNGVNTFGRDGFLTHTYLLRGRPGQSNGCVVFPNYARFLDAYKRGHVKRLVVVASLKASPMQVASASNGR
ncbi:MAG: DUF2778 domain-containing protein [Devosia sp.]|nr:DUF2778 domain-containing protein [Devosia sp.]